MKKRSSPALILSLALLVPASGQNPSSKQERPKDDDDVVRITTNLIQVDAVVTDKNGKLVTDLRAEDFEIHENGEERKITNFSFVSLASAVTQPSKPTTPVDKNAPPVPPATLRPEKVRRTIALVVDDLGLSFESVYFVRRALKNFVDEQMQPGDLVAIIRTGGGMGALQQFTFDKQLLYRAIERVRWNQLGRGGVTSIAAISSDEGQAETTANFQGKTINKADAYDLDEFRNELFTVGTLGSLDFVIRGLREMPGRKSIMLVSDGIRIFNRDGDSQRILELLRRLTDRASRASVVIYTMDARGLQTLGLTAEDSTSNMTQDQIEDTLLNRRSDFLEGQNGLNYLAQQTGGLAIRNHNDLSVGINRMLADQQGYYLIGYQPDAETFDPKRARFNKLKIEVKRPGLKIRYRSGFFGVTDDESRPKAPATRAQQLVRAITSPSLSGLISVRLTSLFTNDAASGSFMQSLLHVDSDQLTFTDEPDGWHKLVFDIMAVTFGESGAVIDEVSRTETVRLRGETHRLVMENGFDYIITVPIKKPGAYQLRTALRDTATERIGTASQFVEVPDLRKNRIALSGIIVNGFDLARQRKVAEGGNAAEDPLTPEPQTGPGVRRFRRGLVLQFGYVIYNAQIDKTNHRPQLRTQTRLFRDGQQVFVGSVQSYDPGAQADLKRLDAGGRILLGTEMSPGDYVLQVVVIDLLARNKQRMVTKWIDFQVSDK